MMKPTEARARAPEKRLSEAGREGSVLLVLACCLSELEVEVEARRELKVGEVDRKLRRLLRVVKYNALPTLVRMTEGSVPRHS